MKPGYAVLIIIAAFIIVGMVDGPEAHKNMAEFTKAEQRLMVAEFIVKEGAPELLIYPTEQECK